MLLVEWFGNWSFVDFDDSSEQKKGVRVVNTNSFFVLKQKHLKNLNPS